MENLYLYNNATRETGIRLSPSALHKFFNYPEDFYKELILKEPSNFKGNTATCLGTTVHYLLEMYAKDPDFSMDKYREKVKNDLENYVEGDSDLMLEVSIEEVLKNYEVMATTAIENYLKDNLPDETEQEVIYDLKPDKSLYIGGTIDNITGTTLVDYKTVNTKPNENSMPINYYIQLLAYAYAVRKSRNINIDTIRIVYITKPLKTVSSRVFVVEKEVTDKDIEFFENVLTRIQKAIDTIKEQPSLVDIIFRQVDPMVSIRKPRLSLEEILYDL